MRASIHSPAIFRLVALFYLGFPSTIRYGEGTFLAESMKAGPKAAATCVLFGCSRIPLEHPVLLVVGEITAAAEMRIRRRGNYVTGRNQSRRYRRPAFVLSPILLARGFLSGISFFSPSCPTGIRATSSTGGYPRSSQVLLTVEAGRSALEEASLDPADRSENGVIDETDPYKIELGNKGPVICRVINGLYQEPLGNALDDDITDALRTMDRLAESGLTTFLLGNGRGGGRALAERRAGAYLKSSAGGTRGSPDARFLNTLSLRPDQPVTRKAINQALAGSMRRMGVECLDLVQLCWHDFEDRYFLDALSFLEEAECALNVGVCGFSAAPLALARKNGFDIASNLVSSSLVASPIGGSETVRQCSEQGIALIATGTSMGGLVAEEWASRSEPKATSDRASEEASLEFRRALSDIHAWGRRGKAGGSLSSPRDDTDPWHLYQTKLLPELQTIARKHGRGLTSADVAIAIHLCGHVFASSSAATAQTSGDDRFPSNRRIADLLANVAASAVAIPARVRAAGSLSARKLAAEEEDRSFGRRGVELSTILDQEDLDRVALAVDQGCVVKRDSSAEGGRFSWEESLYSERESDGEQGRTWEAPKIFL